MRSHRNLRLAGTGALLGALALPMSVQAQQPAPSQSFGITTGLAWNDNRGLDDPSQGDTTELFTRFDFGLVFANPLQSLSLNGAITLRALDGAEKGQIPDGLTDPNLRLRYNRAVRGAQFTVSAFAQETETSTLVEELDGLDLVLVNDNATRLSYGANAELELRRDAPFGVTLLAGYTGLRYSNTTSTALQDQDRANIGARFRFDINEVLKATLTARHSTFEEDGVPGTRETTTLDGSLSQALQSGSFGVNANITSVEEGERYTLSVSRGIEGPLWQATGTLGITEGVNGDSFPTGTLDYRREFDNFSMSFNLTHSVRSGLEDTEQEYTAVRFNYARPLTAVSSLTFNASYQETSPTVAGTRTTSLGTIGLGYQHSLAEGWRLNAGVDRRVSSDAAGSTTRDNRLSLSVRRELSARR
jgi:hypothetical protein